MEKDLQEKWTRQARKRGCSHLLMITDDVTGETFPVYVLPTQVLSDVLEPYSFARSSDQYYVRVLAL